MFLGAAVFAAASAFSLTGTAAHASMIYANSSSKLDASKGLSVRPSGNVYTSDGKLVGHLTDVNGKAIKSIPSSGDYEIQTRAGRIVASSSSSTPGVDSSRSMQITDGSEENSTGSLNTPVTTATNNGMSSSNSNSGNASAASSEAASDKGAESPSPESPGNNNPQIPSPYNNAVNNGGGANTSSSSNNSQ